LEALKKQKEMRSLEEEKNKPKEVVAASKEFSAGNKVILGKFIRDRLYKRYKVTNRLSFGSGDIQRQCHSVMSNEFHCEEAMAVYRDSLVCLVQNELGQKRNQVNGRLLEKWTGT
jgi:hypothetical protein